MTRRLKLPHRVRRLAKGERGAAIVEFAFVLPLLAFLLFGMVDFGRALNYWIDETHLANEAARWAVVNRNPGPSPTLAQSIWEQIITPELKSGSTDASGPVSGARVCVSFIDPGTGAVIDESGANVGHAVKVTVTSDFKWRALLGFATTSLKGEAIMRLEAEPTGLAGCHPA